MTDTRWRLGIFGMALWLAAAAVWGAGALDPAVTRDQIDAANCRTLKNGQAVPLDEALMFNALGFKSAAADPARLWSAGRVEAGNRIALCVMAGIAARGHYYTHAGLFTPLDFLPVQSLLDNRQRDFCQIAFKAR